MNLENAKSNGSTPAGVSRGGRPVPAPREHIGFTPSAGRGKNLGPGSQLTGWNNKDLNKALSYIGWTGSEFSRRIGYSRSQVSRIRTGEAPVPAWMEAYLMLVVKLADIVDGN